MSTSWTFFTNHAHVLFCICSDQDIRLRDVADRVGITERAAQRIVSDLEDAGYLKHVRVGRRNHYEVMTEQTLRHPVESQVRIGDLLEVLGPTSPPD